MTSSIENNPLALALSRFFRTRTDTPLRFTRVLIGGTLGLITFAVGAPLIIYLAAIMMMNLDWVANLFLISLTIVHLAVTQRTRIKSFVAKMRETSVAQPVSRVEPKVSSD